MFDTVGTHNDDEATQRSFLALLLTSCLIGGTTAFTLTVLAYSATSALQPAPEPDPTPIAFLDLPEDVVPQESAPPLPPPPAAPRETVIDDKMTPEPDDLAPDQKPLDDPPKPIASSDRPPGDADGVDGGVKDGKKDGTLRGTQGGTGTCDGCGAGDLRFVHNSEVTPKRRPAIHYPEAARGSSEGDQRCIARVDIDERGVPTRVDVSQCPEVFHQAAMEGLYRWRWYPMRVDGQARAVTTRIAVLFKE